MKYKATFKAETYTAEYIIFADSWLDASRKAWLINRDADWVIKPVSANYKFN